MRLFQKSQDFSALAGYAVLGLAIGATAVGAMAIGALAIGRVLIRDGRIDKLSIGELTVDKLIVTEQFPVVLRSADAPTQTPRKQAPKKVREPRPLRTTEA